jgi:predicted ABC-type ATPase
MGLAEHMKGGINNYFIMNILKSYIKNVLNEMLTVGNRKAIFMAGPGGSGKTTIINNFGLGNKMKIINADDAYEDGLRDAGLPFDRNKMSDEEKKLNWKIFGAARKLTKATQNISTESGDAILIDGTGGNYSEIKNEVDKLRDLGYSVAMIFIDIDLGTAISRNKERGEAGGRRLLDREVEKSHNAILKNKDAYKSMFGNNFFEIDGSDENMKTSMRSARSLVDKFLEQDMV